MSGSGAASDKDDLTRDLRAAGLSSKVIKAAWPSWWSDELSANPSGRAELRFALARRLGVSPRGLLGERVEFVWNDDAKFKHLTAEDEPQRSALTSFGMTIGRMLIRATPVAGSADGLDALILREAILADRPWVDLPSLLGMCWSLGIPVIHLRIFPLEAKSMHAMVVESEGRFAILLGKDAAYPAPVAFTLAHELGHALLGHLSGAQALVDLKDPALARDGDEQEEEADRFALTMLTGQPAPSFTFGKSAFNAPTLAKSAMDTGAARRIEPGTLALCVGHERRTWPVAMSSLQFIYPQKAPVWRFVNATAL